MHNARWVGGSIGRRGFPMLGTGKRDFSQLVKNLFANGEQGFFYDPNDLSTMFQDAAGTIPVTAVGQPVGLWLDKSGRNNHAFQTNSASRPILRKNALQGANYLEFDGADDFLQTSNIDFTATDKVSLFTGVRKLNDAQISSIITSDTRDSGFELYYPPIEGASNYVFAVNGSTGVKFVVSPNYAAPQSSVLTAQASINPELRTIAVNGQKNIAPIEGLGAGNFSNDSIFIGMRLGTVIPLNGHIYSLIGVGKLVSDNETAAIEKELAKRVGVTLNV